MRSPLPRTLEQRIRSVHGAALRFAVCAAAAIVLCGCRAAPKTIDEALRSDDAVDRVRAVREIAAAKDRSRLPELVERLEDGDEVVRFYAIVALERMTGTRRGYAYSASPGGRAAAVASWRRSVGLPVDSEPSEPDKQAASEPEER